MSIFSGLYPSEHGIINWSKKSKKIPLLDDLKTNGYNVQGFTSFRFIKQLFQSSMEIECIGEDFGEYWDINQHQVVNERTLKFLEDNRKNPFFLFYHHSAPHAPYRFPKKELEKVKNNEDFMYYYQKLEYDRLINSMFPQFNNSDLNYIFKNDDEAKIHSSLIAKATTGMIKLEKDQAELIKYLYKKEVEFTDFLFGRIIAKLKDTNLQKNTIICFLADHGELLAEKDKFGHANDYMLNSVLRVPCIIFHPELKEKILVESNISQVNILPTILEMIGVKLDVTIKKRSYWREISEKKQIESIPIYSEGNFRIAVIKDNIKYVTDSKRKGQIIYFKDFLKNSFKLLPTLTDSTDELRNNFTQFLVPYYKRIMGISKDEMYEIDTKNNIERHFLKPKTSLKKKYAKLIEDYYAMKQVDITEELSEEELKIIKVRLEALGYLEKKQEK